MTTWHDGGLPLAPGALDDMERLLGEALPESLRAFYAEHNGGWPEDDEPHPLGVHGYIPLGDGPTDAPALRVELLDVAPQLAGLVPFAYDAGGNTYLARARGAVDPRPVLWLHQENEAVVLDHTLEELLPTQR